MAMHAENDRVVLVQYSRLVAEELQRCGVQAVAKVYPPPKVGGKEREGSMNHARTIKTHTMLREGTPESVFPHLTTGQMLKLAEG